MKSIMQDKKECYISGATNNLHRHHIFYGSKNRSKSEEWGCWVWLTPEWHNLTRGSVHFNIELDYRLKKECQKKFEELYGHDKFMQEFGKNYL